MGKAALLCLIWLAVCLPISVAFEIIKLLGHFQVDAMAALLTQQLIAWPVTLWIALRWGGTNIASAYPLARFPWRLVLPIVIASIGFQILLTGVSSLIPMPAFLREIIYQAVFNAHPIALFGAVVVAAPITEELFFRGAVFGGFRKRYSLTKSMWLSATLFAVFHLNPWQAVVALPLGIFFAWLVLKTGSLLPSILSHFVVNLCGAFLLTPLALMFGYSEESIREMDNLPLPILSAGAALAAIGGGILWRQLREFPTMAACTEDSAKDDPTL